MPMSGSDKVSKLTTGKETDELIAREVMRLVPCDGWLHLYASGFSGWDLAGCRHVPGACYPEGACPKFSEGYDEMFNLIDHMLGRFWSSPYTFDWVGYDDMRWSFTVKLRNSEGGSWYFGERNVDIKEPVVTFAPTRQLAVCEAALQTLTMSKPRPVVDEPSEPKVEVE
jgi:hypothetical protein